MSYSRYPAFRRGFTSLFVGLLLTAGSTAHAQTAEATAHVELASLEGPQFVLPLGDLRPVIDTAMLPPAPADANAAGMALGSRELDRQMRWQKARNLELVYQALNAVDAAQTISCLRAGKCTEGNPLFGSNPSTPTIIGVKAATGALHLLATRYLFNRNSRYLKTFQVASIAIQGGVVAWNASVMF